MRMASSAGTFSEQISVVVEWFNAWNDCEKVVALYCLLRKLPPAQTKFLSQVLDQIVASCSPIDLEEQANDPGFVSSLCVGGEPVDMASTVAYLLHCLPLLRTGNAPAKTAYLHVLPTVLRRSTETGLYLPDCQQILSYALIHPAISGDELITLNACQPQLQDDVSRTFIVGHVSSELVVNGPTTTSTGVELVSNGGGGGGGGGVAVSSSLHRDLSAVRSLPAGLLHHDTSSSSLCGARPSRTTAAAAGGAVYLQHSSPPPGLPRALTPPRLVYGHQQLHRVITLPATHSNSASSSSSLSSSSSVPDWVQRSVKFGSDKKPSSSSQTSRLSVTGDSLCHVPLSPQSSDASSGSAGPDVDDASCTAGMQDVSSWLKSLRLHKYSALFQQMSYDDMLNLTDEWLESRNVTKGARNKILINVQKLQERASVLRQLEKDLMESNDVRSAIGELRQILSTPIRVYDDELSLSGTYSESDCLDDADLPGLITRVLGKLCTELMVKMSPDNDCLTNYLHLLDRCNCHQAFTVEQKKKMLSWRQQIQRVLQFQLQRQHRVASSSASLPPCQPRSGTQRALRGQSPAGAHQALQPSWSFIGAGSSPAHSRLAVNNQPPLAVWQPTTVAQNSNTASAAAAAAPTNLLWRPPQHLEQTAAAAGKLPLGRTQSAPLRSNQTGLSVRHQPVGECDSAAANEDLHASLNKLCISMIGAALDSGINDQL